MSNTQSSKKTPAGWESTTLAHLIVDGPSNGYSPASSTDASGPLTLKLSATTSGEMRLDSETTKRIHEQVPSDSKFWLQHGDLLIQRANTLDHVGAAAIYEGPPNTYIYPDLMMRIRIPAPELRKFVWRYLNTDQARNYFRTRATGTAGNMPKINGTTVRELPILLPPLAEQRRIVSKLESLLARSRRAKEALNAIPDLLERFRQSVLSAAFRGDLTIDWRTQNPDSEPASKLLERIRAERRHFWEQAQFAKMQAKGVLPKNDSWKAAYEEPAPISSAQLPELPTKWCWASFEELSINFDGDRVPVKQEERKKRQGQYPYYGASGAIDSMNEYLFDGDYLLIAEDGANLLSRSSPIAFLASGRFWVNNHAHVVQTPGNMPPLAYLGNYLNSIDLRRFVTGTAQPKLTQKNLNKIPIPLAPADEQNKIIQRINKSLSAIRSSTEASSKAHAQLHQLSNAIIAKAFRGELVPPDPNDEPVSVLLERIRAEREATAGSGPKRPRGRRPAA